MNGVCCIELGSYHLVSGSGNPHMIRRAIVAQMEEPGAKHQHHKELMKLILLKLDNILIINPPPVMLVV